MHRIDRRALLTGVAGLALIGTGQALAHEGHDHGAATPETATDEERGTGTGAVFMTIANSGDAADTLVAASTEIAQSVQIHQSVVEGSTASMRPLEGGLEIPPGEEVILEPSGLHLMLVDLNEDLLPESTFVITLEFALAGTVELTVPIVLERLDDVPPVTVGDLEITGYWSRPAPMLSPSEATPAATPKG